MTPERFEKVVLNRCEKIQSVMASKNKEYAKPDNKFHNFEKSGRKQAKTREDALMGMASKHDVSIDDIVEGIRDGKLPTVGLLQEKIGDMCNYLIILEAMVIDRIENGYTDIYTKPYRDKEREKIIEAFANNPES